MSGSWRSLSWTSRSGQACAEGCDSWSCSWENALRPQHRPAVGAAGTLRALHAAGALRVLRVVLSGRDAVWGEHHLRCKPGESGGLLANADKIVADLRMEAVAATLNGDFGCAAHRFVLRSCPQRLVPIATCKVHAESVALVIVAGTGKSCAATSMRGNVRMECTRTCLDGHDA